MASEGLRGETLESRVDGVAVVSLTAHVDVYLKRKRKSAGRWGRKSIYITAHAHAPWRVKCHAICEGEEGRPLGGVLTSSKFFDSIKFSFSKARNELYSLFGLFLLRRGTWAAI